MSKRTKIGETVKVFLKNGLTFNGKVKKWSPTKGVELIGDSNELIEIYSFTDIVASVWSNIKQNESVIPKPSDEKLLTVGGSLLNEQFKETEDDTIKCDSLNIKRLKNLIELRKAQANEELSSIKQKLTSDKITKEPVDYVNQFSLLRGVKDDTGK